MEHHLQELGMKKIGIGIILFGISLATMASNQDVLFHNPFKGKYVQNPFEQEPPSQKKNWKEKITFGGATSISFGTFTFILLNPQVIYKFNETTWMGAGPYYQYSRQRIGSTVFSSSIYGATAFGRKYVTPDIFGQIEFNQLYQKNPSGGRIGTGYGMIGGGYQPHPNFSIMAMYIFTRDPNGYIPFGGNPWVIRGGINF